MKKRSLIFLIVLVLCLVMVAVAPVIAKYVREKNSVVNISSEEFYFTVDLLGDTNSDDSLEKTFEFYGGDKKEVTFSVQNYFDEFRITQVDINYTISLEVILPEDSSYDKNKVVLDDLSAKTLTKSDKSSNKYTLSVPEGYDNNTEVVITISSTSPYTKTMKLTFVLKTFESEVSYYVIDSANSLYAELFITTNVPIPVGRLLVDFSSINSSSNVLQVDMTNMYLIDKNGVLNNIEDGETYLKKVNNTITINTGEAISIKFFKSDISKDYSLGSTNINGVSEGSENIYKIIIIESE